MSRRVAFVVDRYAPTTFGGAELHAYQLAQRLGARFDTELLTTTAQDYMTWANAFPAGVETIDGVTVRRFRVDLERDVASFDRRSRALLRTPRPSRTRQEAWMGAQGPLSLDLLRYLAHEHDAYDAFVFVSYLYATTYFGLPLVADRALLLPLAHDEWMLRFSMWDRIFALPRGFVYNTLEERALIARRFPRLATGGPAIGVGVDPPPAADAERFRRAWGIERPFALYLGRIDRSKGCDELLRAYRRSSRARELVLVGDRQMPLPPARDVTITGPVDEQTKWDALAACDLLVLPSRYESLSLAALEAWAAGKPVLANARARAVAGQIARSGGGVTYEGERDLAQRLDETEAAGGAEAGRRGRAFVDEHYAWPAVEARFAAHLAEALGWRDALRDG